MNLPQPLVQLIAEFAKLPGIGNKTAKRLAFSLLLKPERQAMDLARAIQEARTKIKHCGVCFGFSDRDICSLCVDPKRNKSQICVVEDPRNIFTIESSGFYQGLYHVLQGVISPLQGVSPEDLKIKELQKRIAESAVEEVILATNSTLEGEATAHFLTDLLQDKVKVLSRIARGMPVGSDLEFADLNTLERSFAGRTAL